MPVAPVSTPRAVRPAPRRPPGSLPRARPKPASSAPGRILLLLGVGLLGLIVVAGGYRRFRHIAASVATPAPAPPGPIAAGPGRLAGLDRSFDLPGSPIGLAWDGTRFVIANRKAPWGFLRVTPGSDGAEVASVPVIEPVNQQNVGLRAVAWNGTQFVGVTDLSWFQPGAGLVFTLHDPATLQILARHPAPERIGALVWDGSGYWAATRNNTEDSPEPRQILRLDAGFQVTASFDSPAAGAQGLAWDGTRLWLADVFQDTVHAFAVVAGVPQPLKSARLPLGYLSGLAWDGETMWLVEYGDNRLHRAAPAAVRDWLGISAVVDLVPIASAPSPVAAASPEELARLRSELVSDDSSARMSARFEAERRGLPVDRRREVESFPETGPEDTELLDWTVWLEGDRLLASWKIHVGRDLFTRSAGEGGVMSMPTFARYTLTVRGGTLGAEVPHEFAAVPGLNQRDSFELARGLGPGKYHVSTFLHVQYLSPQGGNRILNDSAGWLEVEKR